jgi:hypothetical protein
VSLETQFRVVLTKLLQEAPTRFAVLRGEPIQIRVHKSVVTGSRSTVLIQRPGPITGDARILDFPATQDQGATSIHHLRYAPRVQKAVLDADFLRLKQAIDAVVPEEWVRGGRGASDERPRWALDCSPDRATGIEVELDSKPYDQMGLVSRPTGPAIDLIVAVVMCKSKR